MKEEEGSSVTNDFYFFRGGEGGGVFRYPTFNVFVVDLSQCEDLKLSPNRDISRELLITPTRTTTEIGAKHTFLWRKFREIIASFAPRTIAFKKQDFPTKKTSLLSTSRPQKPTGTSNSCPGKSPLGLARGDQIIGSSLTSYVALNLVREPPRAAILHTSKYYTNLTRLGGTTNRPTDRSTL